MAIRTSTARNSFAPRVSPAIFVHEPLESGVDVIDVREGAVHIGITKD